MYTANKLHAANKKRALQINQSGCEPLNLEKTGVLGHLSLLYLIKQLILLISDAYIAQCGERLPTEREVGSSMPGVDCKPFFLFSSFLHFFLLRSHLAKGSICLSVSCVEKIVWSLKSFVSVDCFQIHNIGWVCVGKTTKSFPESNCQGRTILFSLL